jgi:hypothetical protein
MYAEESTKVEMALVRMVTGNEATYSNDSNSSDG